MKNESNTPQSLAEFKENTRLQNNEIFEEKGKTNLSKLNQF